MTDEELVQALGRITQINSWLESLAEEAVKRVVDQGKELPGWRVSLTQTHPKWKDTAKVWRICASENLEENDFAPRELLKPTHMKELFNSVGVDAKVLDQFIGRNPSNFTVVTQENTRSPLYTLAQLRAYKEEQEMLK